ncbi:serine/threonine protein kinase [Mycobacterium yunnanensis]|uniref:non-specific serine/threonine protein kinase n=1 Tax=Mycobacterium yunnanensis TaxID=368477 RepID=A0A9X2YXE9_9MYCO|nr:serine/threonine-protein kinase [Mycobacterium yunnanensis]MCV7419349.1 serine/threonine protein kinase [Mycobacterium yunnanensis]
MPLADGATFAGYVIVRLLGAGAMGEVYLAQHPRLPRQDALKVMAQSVSSDDEYRERFNREAQNVATLWHQNIVAVHDRGEDEGRLWIAMDYVEGTDAGQLLQEKEYRHGMPPADVVRIVSAVADALDYAHVRQLLHRDVKPANILLANLDSDRWRALLADFGIARRVDDASGLTETNMAVGTVAYAAPEQLMGQTLDGRADQYSLAATAFELLTGTHMFLDRNPAVVISRHVSAPPPAIDERKPELSGLQPVLAKALAKSPADRYDTCSDFARALARQLGEQDGVGVDDTVLASRYAGADAKGGRTRGRGWWLGVAAAIAVGVLLIAGVVTGIVIARHQSSQVASAAPSAPPMPVVLVGADCQVLGAAGISETGQKAYCARLPPANTVMWSLVSGVVPSPTVTPGPTDEVYPDGIEEQVRVCVQQTRETRLECREDIRRGNLYGPA